MKNKRKTYLALSLFCILLVFIISLGIYASILPKDWAIFLSYIATLAAIFFGLFVIKEKPQNWRIALFLSFALIFVYMVIWYYGRKNIYWIQTEIFGISIWIWANILTSFVLVILFVFIALYIDKIVNKIKKPKSSS
ncbi:hypothetical protein [Methanolapillus ohkumae]|uniref:Uncharacterized protein n=1 Tax=Methanolapillus ohkumae TaxID=3028298 RepID=A0AA96VFK9_9EURY|nr:hypothetical protein MsAm2_12960 [Methanosarcinaceae archaeon Am2]